MERTPNTYERLKMPTVSAILATADEAALVGLALSHLVTTDGMSTDHAVAVLPLAARFVQYAMALGTDTIGIADDLEDSDDALDPVRDLIERTEFIPFDLPVAAVALEQGELANILSLASFGLKYQQAMGGNIPVWLLESFANLADALVDISEEDSTILADIMDGVDETMGSLVERLMAGETGDEFEAPGYI